MTGAPQSATSVLPVPIISDKSGLDESAMSVAPDTRVDNIHALTEAASAKQIPMIQTRCGWNIINVTAIISAGNTSSTLSVIANNRNIINAYGWRASIRNRLEISAIRRW